eukprot:815624-Prymnesium_polylepis.1
MLAVFKDGDPSGELCTGEAFATELHKQGTVKYSATPTVTEPIYDLLDRLGLRASEEEAGRRVLARGASSNPTRRRVGGSA